MVNQQQTKKDVHSWDGWRKVFALDLRSLALFRILLGCTIIADLIIRLPTFIAMYTDQGYMTRSLSYQYFEAFFPEFWRSGVWSLYWLSGAAEFQYCLFALAAFFAFTLLVGWKTRLSTILSWILLSSLHVRNPLILTSGDTILKLMLFWSMFLPLGRVWSLDAKGKSKQILAKGKAVSNLASAAFIIQLILMYFFTGFAKCNSEWFSGEAMEYVMRLNIYLLPMGETLRQYPLLLKIVTYATLFVEVIGIWWLLSPKRNDLCRVILLVTFCAFHFGIATTMAIGLFPFICIFVWMAFIPSSIWDRFSSDKEVETTTYIGVNKTLLNLGANIVIGVCLVLALLINIANLDHPVCKTLMPRPGMQLCFMLNLDQRFQMFDRPPKDNPWFVYEAQLYDGTFVDLINFQEAEKSERLHQRPDNLRLALPFHHWRKLHRNLVHPLRESFRQPLIDFAVKEWNSKHEDDRKIANAKLVCYLEPTLKDAGPDDLKTFVWGTYSNTNEKALDVKVDDVLNQLLDDENPDLPGF